MKKLLSLLTVLIGLSTSAWAVDVTVTMNSTTKTMKLASKNGAAVSVGSPTAVSGKNKYSFSAEEGTYVLTGYNSSNAVDGTIELNVTESNCEFQIWTVTFKATNSGWTVNKDYTVEDYSVRTREGQTLPITLGANYNTALVSNGGTFNCTFVPSESRKAEGFVDAYGSATFTANANVNAACPKGGTFTVSYPSDANFMLMRKEGGSNGSGSIHYTAFPQLTPLTTSTNAGVTTCTYSLGENNTYNYRLWKTGKRTKAAMFAYSSTDMNGFTFTDADLEGDPKAIDHSPASNLKYNVGNILVNINERGHLRMKSGQTKDLFAQRDWQLTNNSTANYFIEPDYHYTIVNLDGTPITIDNADTNINPWATLHANSKGTALVLVNYDAIHVTQWTNKGVESDYLGGADWGACWPENTAVYVVTVDDEASSADPNMLINENYNTGALKNAGKYVDAEHDIFYYLDTEKGAEYTFTPSDVASVEIAYPTILANTVAYNDGFKAVTANEDGSYTLLLKFGRNIVKMTDASGAVIYQVLTAKPVHREINNVTRPGSKIFQPGDQVKIQHSGLYHPANKMSGIYNMSSYVTFNGVPNGESLILSANQYNFAGTPSAQAVTVTIPADWNVKDNPLFSLTDGVLQVNGYGDPIGNHRKIDKIAGRSPNFTAVAHKTYFGQIPDVDIAVSPVKKITVTPSYNIDEDVTLVIKDVKGNKVAKNANGTYTVTYGTYTYTANAEGYKQTSGSFNIADDSKAAVTVEITLEAIPENGWDGETLTEPEIASGVYQITSGSELAWFANEVTKNKKYAINGTLCNDVDLCGFEWTPIGGANLASSFAGAFDGNDYSIKGLYINSTATYQGLFGYIKNTSSVKNLTVEGSVTTTANYAAGIVAYSNGAPITNCVNKVSVSGKQYVGGITSYAYGSTVIDRCGNEAPVTASSTYAAGITPYAQANTKVTNCYNTADVSATNYAGSLVGSTATQTVVQNCLNTGNVISEGASTGNVCVQNATRTNISNNYVLANYAYGKDYETVVTPEQLTSGEVAYLLGEAWGQEVGYDEIPVLDGMKVYYSESKGYYNSLSDVTKAEYQRTVEEAEAYLAFATEHVGVGLQLYLPAKVKKSADELSAIESLADGYSNVTDYQEGIAVLRAWMARLEPQHPETNKFYQITLKGTELSLNGEEVTLSKEATPMQFHHADGGVYYMYSTPEREYIGYDKGSMSVLERDILSTWEIIHDHANQGYRLLGANGYIGLASKAKEGVSLVGNKTLAESALFTIIEVDAPESPSVEVAEDESSEEATSIAAVESFIKNGKQIYNLSGQRIQTPMSGMIIIVDGKKILVK